MNELEKALLSTESIKIAQENSPFWYTSGTIGPYFINTHFLLGSEKKANDFLNFININKENYKKFIPELIDRIISIYKSNIIFKKSIDNFYANIKTKKEFIQSEYISGGERRDWFFSPIIAYLSNKKLLFIYKDLKIFTENSQVTDLKQANVSHICDLVTQASSYKRAWIPALKKINAKLSFTAAVVDRDEGGTDYFNKLKIKYYSAVLINKVFLNDLLKNNIINNNQYNLIIDFKKNPINYGKTYLTNNPQYLLSSLNDIKNSTKVKTCINENPYNINFNKNPFDLINLKIK